MSIRFRLSEADCITLNGIDHVLEHYDELGVILRARDASSRRLSFSHEEIMQLLSQPDVRLERDYFAAGQIARRARCDQRYLSSLPPEARQKLLWKASYCEAFLEAEAKHKACRTLGSISQILPALTMRVDERETICQLPAGNHKVGKPVTRFLPPSPTALRSWIRLYERCARSPLAFLRKRRSDLSYARKLVGETEILLAECVSEYLSRNKPSQQMVVDRTRTRFIETNEKRALLGLPALPIPSARSVRRRIAKLDPFEVTVRREGAEFAKRKFAFYEEGVSTSYPLERIEMDEWNIDVVSLFGRSGALDALRPEERARFEVGRRWLYVALDCATRCIVSLRIVVNPSAEDAIRALELITIDKTPIARAANCDSDWPYFGGIGTLVTDQGAAFASADFRSAVCDLHGTYEAPPAGVPKLRAGIERLFGTFGAQLMPYLIGRTFSNPQERGDYPSEQWAALTDDELAEIFANFVVDIYHNTPHSGLGGETPANAWKRLANERWITPPPTLIERTVVFGVPLQRKIGRHGVLVHGIHYSCSELQQALLTGHNRMVRVRVNPRDLTFICVEVAGEWRIAEAVSKAVTGLSLEEWQRLVFELRCKHRGEAALSEEIIRKARKRLVSIDQRARELMRIQPDRTTAGDLEQLEKTLFLGLRIKLSGHETEDLVPITDDLFGDVITPFQAAVDHENLTEADDQKPWELSDD